MDSLLARQSGQRILPNESCLLAKNREQSSESQEGHTAGVDTRAAKDCRTTRAHLIKAYSPRMKLRPYRALFFVHNGVAHLPHHSAPLKSTLHTRTQKQNSPFPYLPWHWVLFFLFFKSPITEKKK